MDDRISINSICFGGAPLAVVARNWEVLQARRVSIVSDLLPGDDITPLRHVLETGGHRLETIMHPFLIGHHLDTGDEHIRTARLRLNTLIDAAERLGAKSIYTVAGGHGALSWEDAAERFCDAIAPCLVRAREAGVAMLIENSPAIYADVHIAHTLRDAITLAEMAGMGVVFELFGCWTEADLRGSIKRAIPRCGLVQVSDYVYGDRALPARAVPGDGAIQLRTLLEWILDAGYTGIFDLELLGPRIDREGHVAATRRAAENVSAMLESLDARAPA